jgi:excisionase family DNA binding protein
MKKFVEQPGAGKRKPDGPSTARIPSAFSQTADVSPSDAEKASDAFLDKVGVAKRLGVKPKTVGAWARNGKIPAYRIGRRLRFKWAEVEQRLAATCRVVGPAKEVGVRR